MYTVDYITHHISAALVQTCNKNRRMFKKTKSADITVEYGRIDVMVELEFSLKNLKRTTRLKYYSKK